MHQLCASHHGKGLCTLPPVCTMTEILVFYSQASARAQGEGLNPALSDSKAILSVSEDKALTTAAQFVQFPAQRVCCLRGSS